MTHYQVGPWSLQDLFPSDQAWEEALKELDAKVAAFEAHREELRADIPPETFVAWLQELEELHELAARIGSYAHLRFSENTQDPQAQAMLGKMRQVMAQIENRLLFFELWWRNLDDATAQRLMDAAGERYRYYLEKQRLYRPYTLSEGEEKVINLKDVSGIRALLATYSTLTNRYTFRLEVDGEVKELTRGELMTYARSPRADLRERAYRVLYEVYLHDKGLIAPIYQAVTQDWYNEQVVLRGYPRPISARNLHNHLPDEAVDTLLEVSRRNASVFQRFFRLKARVLGLDKLRRYDIYAPVSQAQREYDFDTAVHLVLDAFSEFDPKFAALARQVLDRHHVHSEVKPGKSGGAFCATPYPGATPWVLLNYQGRLDDVATLAHELGHAIHGLLAGHHSLFAFHAPLPLAETASTFAEMLLLDYLLAREDDPAVRRDILFKRLDDNYATIMRQAYFALFEIQAHDRFPQGASAADIAAGYRDLLAEQFGDAVEVSDEFAWEWLMIPHFYRVPFYVYAYAFGQLLVLALYQRYQEEGPAFKPVYFRLLEAGGSRAPMEILAEAGVDPRQPAFWQRGYDLLAQWVDALEADAAA
ncbi:MAG: M3 family oligoendopeptidase [Chloroflexi bacterium]|nr:M3 family oligoendopeptidase [Chloroflexota bacterium]